MESQPTEVSTLYPKITNHVNEIVKTLRDIKQHEQDCEDPQLGPVPLIGTVKLHGTHADILIHTNDTITFQSRNRTDLSCKQDNLGFATTMSAKSKVLLRLRDLYLARWKILNPDTLLDPSCPVLVAGEWVGEKVQKNVAVSQLSRRFVIISIMINGQWQRDQDFSGINLPNHDIYNISRAGIYHATLYPNDIQRTVKELEPIAEAVAALCPFSETFGVTGAGEGLVWKPVQPELSGNPTLWFKTKGGMFKPEFARAPKKSFSFDTVGANRRAAADVAQVWCSEQRLEQGLDVLRERNIPLTMAGLGRYLDWIKQDILTEEKGFIEEHNVERKELKIEITKIAKSWYFDNLNQ